MLGTFLERWHKNGIFGTRLMEDGTHAHLAVLREQWCQGHRVKSQILLRLAHEQSKSHPD